MKLEPSNVGLVHYLLKLLLAGLASSASFSISTRLVKGYLAKSFLYKAREIKILKGKRIPPLLCG